MNPLRRSAELIRRELPLYARNEDDHRRAVHRYFAYDVIRRLTPFCGVSGDGVVFLVNTEDQVLARTTYMHGSFDLREMEAAVSCVERVSGSRDLLVDRRFLDVGANIGTTSVQACRRFGALGSWAFEPDPNNLKMLRCNLILNDLQEEVVVVPVALSARRGEGVLALSPDNHGDHRLVAGIPSRSDRRTVTVPLSTLDDCVTELDIDLSDVALLWVDTQGHEASVLQGSSTVLQAAVPTVIEYWPWGLERSGNLEPLHDLLRMFGSVIDVQASMHAGRPIDVGGRGLTTIERELRERHAAGDLAAHRDLVLLH